MGLFEKLMRVGVNFFLNYLMGEVGFEGAGGGRGSREGGGGGSGDGGSEEPCFLHGKCGGCGLLSFFFFFPLCVCVLVGKGKLGGNWWKGQTRPIYIAM